MLEAVRNLYEGDSQRSHRFRYGLLAFDMATVVFVIVTSFMPCEPWLEAVDTAIGILILCDLVARFASSRTPWRFLVYLPAQRRF